MANKSKDIDLETTDYKAKLADEFAEVKRRNKLVEEKSVRNKSLLEENRLSLIRELFSIMQQNGVDPSDLESIREFLDRLYEKNPELAAMFEKAFITLTEGDEESMPAEGEAPTNLMDRYQNLSNETFRGQEGEMNNYQEDEIQELS